MECNHRISQLDLHNPKREFFIESFVDFKGDIAFRNGYNRLDQPGQIGFESIPSNYVNREEDRRQNGPRESSAPPRPPVPDRSTKTIPQ